MYIPTFLVVIISVIIAGLIISFIRRNDDLEQRVDNLEGHFDEGNCGFNDEDSETQQRAKEEMDNYLKYQELKAVVKVVNEKISDKPKEENKNKK